MELANDQDIVLPWIVIPTNVIAPAVTANDQDIILPWIVIPTNVIAPAVTAND
jgi:hypothetical protein